MGTDIGRAALAVGDNEDLLAVMLNVTIPQTRQR